MLESFGDRVDAAGGKRTYQSMINQALRGFMLREREPLELTLRRAVREELANDTVNPSSEQPTDDPS